MFRLPYPSGSGGPAACFACPGRAKNADAAASIRADTRGGTPWLTALKKPRSAHARTSRRASSPHGADMSTVGIMPSGSDSGAISRPAADGTTMAGLILPDMNMVARRARARERVLEWQGTVHVYIDLAVLRINGWGPV